jgi:hypothetical protein
MWRREGSSDHAGEIEATNLRHHHIREHQVRAVSLQELQRFCSIARGINHVAFFQHAHDESAKVVFVFSNQ